MRKSVFYTLLLVSVISILFLAKTAFAADFFVDLKWSTISNWLADFLNIPRQLMAPKNILYRVILPFLLVFVAVLGIMRDIMIFRRSRNLDWIMALLITFVALPSLKVMGPLIMLLYNATGIVSVLLVGLMIGIGAFFWFIGGIHRMGGEVGIYKTKKTAIDKLESQIKDIDSQIETELAHVPVNLSRVNKLYDTRSKVLAQMKDLKSV